eukprot:TRINITY_DN671_c0_g1_i1.p1 TRINITY_DN671_c0_g1~~TRINITY_DN671_c0_g1_i1.p1  ORF type:complete len:181 (-),score=29.42 TRINITY_DN671_c0_g1_i1:87-629(-)
MSAEFVRLGTEELCQWLRDRSGLNQSKLEAALKVIEEQDIEGADFLTITKADWIGVGLTLGVATSLVRIARQTNLTQLDQEKMIEVNQSPPEKHCKIDRKFTVDKECRMRDGVSSGGSKDSSKRLWWYCSSSEPFCTGLDIQCKEQSFSKCKRVSHLLCSYLEEFWSRPYKLLPEKLKDE